MSDLIPPKACSSMQELRSQIDHLDQEIVSLLAVRASYIDRAIELKQENGWPARIPDRVEDVVSKARAAASDQGLDPDLIEQVWRILIEWSITREAQVIRAE